MSKKSKPSTPEITDIGQAGKGETNTRLFAKSGWPKTAKETFKVFLNLFLNLFS